MTKSPILFQMVLSQKRNKASRKRALEKSRDGLKNAVENKASRKKSRKPALVPVPEGIELLLELSNLIPAHFRFPYWAAREREKQNKSSFFKSKDVVLNWHLNAISFNSFMVLWQDLKASLDALPLQLQMFVLHDEQGAQLDVEGRLRRLIIDADFQSLRNLTMIKEDEEKLSSIVGEAAIRIDQSLKDQLSSKRRHRIKDFEKIEELLERARQRFIFAFAIQELLAYLIYPERMNQLFFPTLYYRSEAGRSKVYIDQEGKIQFAPPSVVSLLKGIEALRIKECAICCKYFWAGRRDMRCCSTQCAHTLRQRIYRERYYERYK